jgi:RHS repeat-associated protein
MPSKLKQNGRSTPYIGDFTNGVGLGYTGKPYDTVTGMYNYGYRDYAPEVARFTTIDPIRDGANWFAYVNNDPINWVDLWGLYVINNVAGPSAKDYQEQHSGIFDLGLGGQTIQTTGNLGFPTSPADIELPNKLNDSLSTAYRYQTDNNPNTNATITSKATPLPNGNYELSITVTNTAIPPAGSSISKTTTGVIAYTNPGEVGVGRGTATNVNPKDVHNIANSIINRVNGTNHDYQVSCSD